MNNAEQTEDPVLSLIKIRLPNNELFDLQVHPLGIVKDIYLILMEREETCHRTCFSLKLNNMVDYLDELKPIRELENDVVFVVEELYNEREAKFHIKHIHDLLRYVELTDAYLGRNQKSLSFVNIITEGFLLESKYQQTSDSLDSEPPEYILPLRNNSVNDLQLTHLHPIEIEIKPNICLQSLNYSYWNPPSSDRVLHGDLVYLYVHTREDKRIHITGCPKGFYVNQSTDESFNPEKEGLLFHSIIDLLKNVSSLFNQNYVSLIKRRSNRHAFERIKTPYQIYSWLSPIFEHNLDSIRKKEEFCSKITFEEYPPAETRDWNNEMQNSRELPRENKFDRVNREKLIFKTNIDFVTVATRGAMSILRGNIMAIDPRKCKKQQSFYWNNIFFELGFDNDDYYRDMGGDPAAYAAIMHHFNKTCFYYSLDIPGLCTLDTVVIDFAGYRVKATPRNIIPKEQADNGIVFDSPYLTNIDRYLEYPEIISDELKVSKIDNYQAFPKSMIFWEGLISNDKRFYIPHELFSFPPDVHYLGGVEDPTRTKGHKVITNKDLSSYVTRFNYPFAHRHQFSILRHTILEAFCANDLKNWLSGIELANDLHIRMFSKYFDKYSNDDLKFAMMFNPDAFKLGLTEPIFEEQDIEFQRQLLKDVSEFLVIDQIPTLIDNILKKIVTPKDGRSLVEAMHKMGINTRYLNRLIEDIHEMRILSWLETIAVSEILIRSTKHLFKPYLQEVDTMNMSSSIAHFLNCLLSSSTNPAYYSETCIFKTPAILWTRIKDEALAYYHYNIDCIDVYSFCCKYKVSRITLLRNFCQCLGIQLLLRDYTFDQKNKQTFNNEDIMNIYPVVKHLNPHASDAHELISLGQLNLLQGNVFEGREFLKKALNLFNQVYGPLHPDTASCNRSLARSSYKLGDYQAAIKYQHKSTMISERVHGVDSSIIISEYYYLGKYSYKCNRFNVALNCMYRARYVALLCHGKNHPEMTKIDLNIGKMLVAVKNYDKAKKFLLSARQTAILFEEKRKKITSCYMWTARVYGYIGRFQEAIMYESMCCLFYIENFGPEHVRTKDSKTHIEFLENQLKYRLSIYVCEVIFFFPRKSKE